MFNDRNKLRGQPCIVLKRCSSAAQVGTSMTNQGRTTEQAIAELELKLVDEKDLPAVSGSVPGNRQDIDELIHRKKSRNDFNVLVIQDTSRFTRAGASHGHKLLFDLRVADIMVYFVAEDLLIDGEMAENYASFLFGAARHAVKMLAYNATNGSTASYLEDRSPYTKRPPFGMDRMYSSDGLDRHIIRNLADGTQQQLDPKLLTLNRCFAKNDKKGIPNHYIKQKSERVRLIPGDPKIMAVVHLMFRLYLIDRWSYFRIARFLNDNGVPTSMGKEWVAIGVKKVVLNPIYIGEGIRGKTKSGIYFNVSAGSPAPSNVSLKTLAERKTIPVTMRPRTQWLERPQKDVAEFLPEELRELARERIGQHLASIADARPKAKPNRDRHLYSKFFLKHFLVSKQGGYKMSGRVGGSSGVVRTYAVARGINTPKTGNVLARRIQAEPLETAVLEMVRDVVLNRPGIEDAIKQLVAQEIGQRRDDQKDPEKLQKEIHRKRRQLVVLSDDVSLEEDDALTRKIATVKAEMQALEQRLKETKDQMPPKPTDVAGIAASLARELEDFGRHINEQDVPHIQRVLEVLVTRMEADLITRSVEVELAVPTWMANAISRHGEVGLDEVSIYKTVNEAHDKNRIILGVFDCKRTVRPICYTCRRVKKAA